MSVFKGKLLNSFLHGMEGIFATKIDIEITSGRYRIFQPFIPLLSDHVSVNGVSKDDLEYSDHPV